jgi:hypothetical protein
MRPERPTALCAASMQHMSFVRNVVREPSGGRQFDSLSLRCVKARLESRRGVRGRIRASELSQGAPSLNNNFEPRRSSRRLCARQTSSAPVCGGRFYEKDRPRRSKPPFLPLQSPRTRRDCPPCHCSEKSPASRAAACSALKSSPEFATRPSRQKATRSFRPKSDAL